MREPEDAVPVPEADAVTRVGAGGRGRDGSSASKAKYGDGIAALLLWGTMAAYGAAIGISIAVGDHMVASTTTQYGFVILGMVTMTLLLVCIGALVAYFRAGVVDAQERRRPLRIAIVFGVGLLLGIAWMALIVSTSAPVIST